MIHATAMATNESNYGACRASASLTVINVHTGYSAVSSEATQPLATCRTTAAFLASAIEAPQQIAASVLESVWAVGLS